MKVNEGSSDSIIGQEERGSKGDANQEEECLANEGKGSELEERGEDGEGKGKDSIRSG